MTKTETLPSVFCVVAYQKNLLQSAHCLEQEFISADFSNWKDATAKFSKHKVSQCHKDSVLKTITLPATTCDVARATEPQRPGRPWPTHFLGQLYTYTCIYILTSR